LFEKHRTGDCRRRRRRRRRRRQLQALGLLQLTRQPLKIFTAEIQY
jgi:hypothetical protein